MQSIMNITDIKGQDYFCSSYKYAFDNNIVNIKGNFNGKISFVQDPEAKLRVIAISDYYTQLFLKSIHDILYNLIKNLHYTDRTFTQDPMHF